MKSSIRPTAVSLAVLLFFIMAIAGWFCGLNPSTCASRAFAGAILTYIVVSWAGKIIVNIIIQSIVDSKLSKLNRKDNQK
jgi:hypothetical protein